MQGFGKENVEAESRKYKVLVRKRRNFSPKKCIVLARKIWSLNLFEKMQGCDKEKSKFSRRNAKIWQEKVEIASRKCKVLARKSRNGVEEMQGFGKKNWSLIEEMQIFEVLKLEKSELSRGNARFWKGKVEF